MASHNTRHSQRNLYQYGPSSAGGHASSQRTIANGSYVRPAGTSSEAYPAPAPVRGQHPSSNGHVQYPPSGPTQPYTGYNPYTYAGDQSTRADNGPASNNQQLSSSTPTWSNYPPVRNNYSGSTHYTPPNYVDIPGGFPLSQYRPMFQLSQGLQNNGPHTMTAHPAMANEAQDQVSAVHPTSHTAVESTSGNAAPVPLSDTNNYNSPPYPVYNPVNSHQQTYAKHTSTTTVPQAPPISSHVNQDGLHLPSLLGAQHTPTLAPIRGTHALQINMADQLAFINHRDADLTRKIASFFFLLQALRMRGNREENTPARVMQFLASSLVANTVADLGRRAYAGGFDGSGNGDGDAETILKFYGLAAVVVEKIEQERVEWEEEMRGRSRVRKGGGRGVHGNGVDSEGEAVDGTFGPRNGGPVDGRGDAAAEGNGQESRDTKVLPDRSTDVRKEERMNGEQKQSNSLTNGRNEAPGSRRTQSGTKSQPAAGDRFDVNRAGSCYSSHM